jgi:hypothetical protein
MKSGNLKIVFSMIALGYTIGSLSLISKNKIKNISDLNTSQYVNRLKEFFFEDYSEAVKNYISLVASGFSLQAAFDKIVSTIDIQEVLIGETND